MEYDPLRVAGSADPFTQALVAPLAELEARYRSAASVALNLAQELNRIASPARGTGWRGRRVPASEESDVELLARLEVNFQDDEALLDFQDMVKSLPGVAHVTSLGRGPKQVTLLVDLEPPQPIGGTGAEPAQASGRPTLICSVCETVLAEGSSAISHGLCADCAALFVGLRQQRGVAGEGDES